MSDFLKHECGIALVRLRKTAAYYIEKYGSPLYGFNQLFMLMEKQRNRGQDGAGIGCVKIDPLSGQPFIFRDRSIDSGAINQIFKRQLDQYDQLKKEGKIYPEFPTTIKDNFDFGGEVLLGHLRYATSGNYDMNFCHPYLRRSNWITKNLMVAGNFNITNVSQLNRNLFARGQHPIAGTDTNTILEEIGFHLDEEHDRIYKTLKSSTLSGLEIQKEISDKLDLHSVIKNSSKEWDGGFVIGGVVGNGDCFVLRDPWGIRPCFYFYDDEFVVFASERVPLMTIFSKKFEDIQEVKRGHVVITKSTGEIAQVEYRKPELRKSCSFEHIYFSRGNDREIYKSRKKLGAALVPQILKTTGDNFREIVLSFIPNTAEVGYYGMMDGLRNYRRQQVKREIIKLFKEDNCNEEKIDQLIMSNWPKSEKVTLKDEKLRTFISQEKDRKAMASHVYDITYGIVGFNDTLVVLDDSIVRGTTLRRSIIKILSRTKPLEIVVVSTAPQIRYPDCYGIDMSELGNFIAFQATISLIEEQGASFLKKEVYQDCLQELEKPFEERKNPVQRLYDRFTEEQISKKIASLVYPDTCGEWSGKVTVVYQTIDNLHQCLPEEISGDWYFTGNYPTAGGYTVINKAYINYYEKKAGRSY